MYRPEDAGEYWTSIAAGLPAHFGFPIEMLPNRERTIYVVPEVSTKFRYTPDGVFAVYRSPDGGHNWQKLSRGLPARGAYLNICRETMATDACTPGGVHIGTSTGPVLSCRDEGSRWEVLADFLPPVYLITTAVLD